MGEDTEMATSRNGIQARQRGNPGLMLEMSLLPTADSLGAQSSVASHWYNTVLILIDIN